MASKTHREAGSRDGPAAEALDGLYAAPLDDFVTKRRDAVAALRAAGEVAAARLVATAAKPSRTAWALNQVARRRPELLASALSARALAAAAQATAEGEALRATARAYRDALAALVQAASDAAQEDGAELTPAQGRRISATVQAAAGTDDPDVRETMLAGRLAKDIDIDDPFAGLEVGPEREPRHDVGPPARHDPATRRAAEAGREREKARERERQAHEREQLRQAQALEEARARVVALEEEAREARVAAREAEVAADRARVEAERLRRAVEAVEKRLSDARGELRSRSK
jgi:cell division septum initiation protein DivIVA